MLGARLVERLEPEAERSRTTGGRTPRDLLDPEFDLEAPELGLLVVPREPKVLDPRELEPELPDRVAWEPEELRGVLWELLEAVDPADLRVGSPNLRQPLGVWLDDDLGVALRVADLLGLLVACRDPEVLGLAERVAVEPDVRAGSPNLRHPLEVVERVAPRDGAADRWALVTLAPDCPALEAVDLVARPAVAER